MGVVRDSPKFSGQRYIGRLAVVFAIAQLSCFTIVFALRSLNVATLDQEEYPQISRGIGVRWLKQKTCNISETGQDRTRLLLMTNRKLHTRFRLVPKTEINNLG